MYQMKVRPLQHEVSFSMSLCTVPCMLLGRTRLANVVIYKSVVVIVVSGTSHRISIHIVSVVTSDF